jgi:tryptophanyl-tRNA synthetase
VRLSDPGQPSQCPVWQFHLLYSDDATKAWVETGCTTAGIGCLECKKPVIDAVIAEQEQIIAGEAGAIEQSPGGDQGGTSPASTSDQEVA